MRKRWYLAKLFDCFGRWSIAGILLVRGVFAAEVWLESGQAESGQTVSMPLMAANGTNIATVTIQINYDPELLHFLSATNLPGTCGASFALYQDASRDGVLTLILYREDGLFEFAGHLAEISFRLYPGTRPGAHGEVIIANIGFADQYGGDLLATITASQRKAQVWHVLSSTNDADEDGLSDYEEQMLNGSPDYNLVAGDTDVNNPDTDGDGMFDGWEVQYGLNPVSNDGEDDKDGDGLNNRLEAQLRYNPVNGDTDGDGYQDMWEYIAGTDGTDQEDYLALLLTTPTAPDTHVVRWCSVSGRVYAVQFITNMADAWPGVVLHEVRGDGTLKSFTNVTGQSGFYRLVVVRE